MRPLKKLLSGALALSVLLCCLTACSSGASGAAAAEAFSAEEQEPAGNPDDYLKAEQTEKNISDNDALYENEDDGSVITMHLTVSPGNAADGSDHTWTEINTYSAYYYEDLGIDRYQAEGILTIDDGNGIDEDDFGYGAEVPNVSVQIRGQTSTRYAQKNYKIRIKEGMGSYEGQRTLDLNKHMMAPFRFNNKLAYDLLEDIPQLLSARTQFVHLYVTDNTEGGSGQEEDYGLFVMVEQVNRTYMKAHGLDENGELYKVNSFAWEKSEPVMADPDDTEYDKTAFEKYLEIKGREDHGLLHETIEELQNYQMPIEDIIEKHFDVENLTYWLAFQILTGNYDAGSRNLFLYSPLNSDKFYILSWDMDVIFLRSYYESIGYTEGSSWETGMTQFLNVTLFNRMFKEEKYRTALNDAVEDLRQNYLTEEKIGSLVSVYSPIVEQYLAQSPDVTNSLLVTSEAFEEAAAKIPGEVQQNYELYLESLKKPWPFYVDLPDITNGICSLSWGISYDMGREGVTYNYMLARDYDFTDVIAQQSGLAVPYVQISSPGQGTYYLKVTASNAAGYTTDCFDYCSTSNGKVYGCYQFSIDAEENVSVEESEE